MEPQEPLKVFVFSQGESLTGTPSWWIALDDDEDPEECLEAKAISQKDYDSIREDGYLPTGFFKSKEEAVTGAEKRGWTVTNK